MDAVRQLIYEVKTVTMIELCIALAANVEGYENVRELCLKAPKYGNDDKRLPTNYNLLCEGEEPNVGKNKRRGRAITDLSCALNAPRFMKAMAWRTVVFLKGAVRCAVNDAQHRKTSASESSSW